MFSAASNFLSSGKGFKLECLLGLSEGLAVLREPVVALLSKLEGSPELGLLLDCQGLPVAGASRCLT